MADPTVPLRFIFGLHLHQPVGNFDHVFRQHVDDVYRPLLDTLEQAGLLPAVLHVSGPLLEWLDKHEPAWLDRVRALARSGQLELLLSGYYEPILASLPRPDRVEQVAWMRDAIRRRLGVEASTLWLTERVWEPELAADLHDAGVQAVLVDDRHFLVAGFDRRALHGWFRTESDGKGVGVFPIDERLRYLIPFRPPEETAAYLRGLHREGQPLAILADDGEKFGGWPGTKEWVYEKGWFEQFGIAIRELVAEGTIQLGTFSEALRTLPSSGIAYLPTASYREMEGWSLPAAPQLALGALERELGEERLAGPEGSLVRGSHWRNFMVKYAEANRLQKMMSALSRTCRDRGDPPEARRLIGAAQCNDAYWHGVFGGLYLPHLRHALWDRLALAESAMRKGEPLEVEQWDLDGDGNDEVWIHSELVSLVVSPARGGAVEVLMDLARGCNVGDVLTRRREAYHQGAATAAKAAKAARQGGAPSIHDLEDGLRLDQLPSLDPHVRAIGVERLLPLDVSEEALRDGTQVALRSWADERLALVGDPANESLGVVLRLESADGSLVKIIAVSPAGSVHWFYEWDRTDGWFAVELSLSEAVTIEPGEGARVIRYPIETVSKSEKGFDRTVQGESVVVLFPADQPLGILKLVPG